MTDWTFFHGGTSTSISTSATGGDQSYAADANNTTVPSTPTSINKAFILTGLSIANGATYYFRWRYTVSGSTNAQAIGIDNLTLGIPYYWNGGNIAATPAAGGTGNWGTTNAWRTHTNTGVQASWTNNAAAIFEGTAGTVTVDVSNRSPISSTFNTTGYALAASTSYTVSGTVSIGSGIGLILEPSANTLSLSGIISGAGSLTKQGAGLSTLSGSNTYSGGTTLSAGTLNIGNGSALGTGTLTINGGTLDQTGSSSGTINLSGNNAQVWGGDFSYLGSATAILGMGSGAVSLTANRTVTVTANTLIVNGIISGSGFGITKAGVGILQLGGASTYTGATTVNAGTLQLANGNTRLPITTALTVASGATFDVNSRTQAIGSLEGAGNVTISTGFLTVGDCKSIQAVL